MMTGKQRWSIGAAHEKAAWRRGNAYLLHVAMMVEPLSTDH